MPCEESVLREMCAHTLERSELPELGARIEGKVRDSYLSAGEGGESGETDGGGQEARRTIVVSDRISCFDVVCGTVPLKGQVLNQLAAFWFKHTRHIAPNHLLAVPDPCVSVVRQVQILPVEFVMRGYLTGVSNTSIWTAYAQGAREYCGHQLPDGMQKHQPLQQPLLTPTTKAPKGGHDENLAAGEIISRGILKEELFEKAAALSHQLFAEGQAFAAKRGLILVDTKYEFGLTPSGELVVADEIHTPDSSRYWYAEGYQEALQQGGDPKALDKEYVRRWLAAAPPDGPGWRGEGAPPALPTDVRVEAARRYIEAFERVTGAEFHANTEAPAPRLRRNLGLQ